jgi:hypothetical protein
MDNKKNMSNKKNITGIYAIFLVALIVFVFVLIQEVSREVLMVLVIVFLALLMFLHGRLREITVSSQYIEFYYWFYVIKIPLNTKIKIEIFNKSYHKHKPILRFHFKKRIIEKNVPWIILVIKPDFIDFHHQKKAKDFIGKIRNSEHSINLDLDKIDSILDSPTNNIFKIDNYGVRQMESPEDKVVKDIVSTFDKYKRIAFIVLGLLVGLLFLFAYLSA